MVAHNPYTTRQTDRQTDAETGRQTARGTDRQTDRQAPLQNVFCCLVLLATGTKKEKGPASVLRTGRWLSLLYRARAESQQHNLLLPVEGLV